MTAYLLDVVSLAVRWLHVIAGIAWIGASFYFVWLDNHLVPPDPPKDRVAGEVWSVHGGGFYNKQKYGLAPERLPKHLHWFKWEAYWTWISGFALLVIVYYLHADSYLIDASVRDLQPLEAVLISVLGLIAAWVVYDGLCRTPLVDHGFIFCVIGVGLTAGAGYAAQQVFSGRGAYIQVGAMIGTCMAANVLMVIIPGQQTVVQAMQAGVTPDPKYGKRGKERSVHNNYLTLGVVLAMISNHYPVVFGGRWAWAVLAGMVAIGMLVRHFVNERQRGNTRVLPVVGTVAIAAGLIVLLAPRDAALPVSGGTPATFAEVATIVEERCASCHALAPSDSSFSAAPGGVELDAPDKIAAQAERIYRQAAVSTAMPLGNKTGITDEERAVLASWYRAGAPSS